MRLPLRPFLLASVLLAPLPPVLAVPPPAAASPITEATLDNGLKVLLIEAHHAPIVVVSAWYRAGSKHESYGTTGLAHLLEHMMFKGTAKYGKGEYDRVLKINGGDNNASTWFDRTNYYAVIAADRAEIALELEADRMRNALFTEKDLADEMPVVRNELERSEDSPESELYDVMTATAFREHPYHHPTIGWRSDVESITAAQIHSFYDRFYWPNHSFLVVAGDFAPQEMLAKVRKHFGPIPSGGVAPAVVTVEPPQKGERRFTLRETGRTEHLMVAYHVPRAGEPDSYALDLLGQILGSGRTARLYQALVEPGLAVSVDADNEGPMADPVLFTLGVAIKEGETPAAVEAAIDSELERVKSEPVTAAELARAVKQNKVQFIFSRDRVISQAFRLGEAEIGPGYRFLDSYLERVQAVTPADLQRVARTYLVRDNRSVGLYLPYAEGEAPPAYLEASRAGKDAKPSRRPGGPHAVRDEDAPDSRPLFGARTGTLARSASAKAAGAVAAVPTVLRETLPNGMTLLIRENHGNATVEVRGGAWAGAAFEPAAKAGVANLLTEMLDRGTQTRSADRIAEELESNGASVRFGAGRERITFSTRSITDDFPLVVDLLADMLRNSTFPEEELVLARDQVLHQIEERDEDTGSRAELAALAKIYGPENPYGRPLEGTAQSVAAITREDLASHYRKAFIPAGVVISIVGDVDPKAVVRLFAEKFPGRKEKVAFDPAGLRKLSDGTDSRGSEIPVTMADKEQVDLVFARRGISRTDPDYYAATMANFIFGGDFTSRLNKELRDNRGLTYGTYSSFSAGMGRGAWTASIGVNPANTRKAKDGVREMLANVVASGVTLTELDEAKTYLTGSYPVRLETNGAVAGALLEAELYGLGLDFIQHYPSILAALTLDEVNRAARKYFVPGDQVMAAAGTLPQE